ncbi:MAG: riboflavin biosynthesis protein RibF [Bacteroidia bacterium]|nr:riboflavin biosynthesis protein RibF [Bacteroidia bacterium]MDW8014711.1 riboflavin biosynthesis protein RibF [Bacteroidia bacterium]
MVTYYNKERGPKGGILTMGTFDGVHHGHRRILHSTRAWADRLCTFAEAWIFHPHPRTVLRNEQVPLITSIEERIALLHHEGIQVTRVISFTSAVAYLSAEAFIQEWIKAVANPQGIVLGHDHRFGRNREGNANLLIQKGIPIHQEQAEQREGRAISSSWIRELIQTGKMEKVHNLLGYPFTVRGTVHPGKGEARTLAVPTANLSYPPEKPCPPFGVYVGWAALHEIQPLPVSQGIPALLYLSPARELEVHLLEGHYSNLYGTSIAVGFLAYMRPHIPFSSIEEISEKIQEDLHKAHSYFAELRPSARQLE